MTSLDRGPTFVPMRVKEFGPDDHQDFGVDHNGGHWRTAALQDRRTRACPPALTTVTETEHDEDQALEAEGQEPGRRAEPGSRQECNWRP
jgi:hypothetical protein